MEIRLGADVCPAVESSNIPACVLWQEPKILNARNPGRTAALGFILVNVFLDALSFGLIFPIVPKR